MPKNKLLFLSVDRTILEVRHRVFREAGYAVTSVIGIEEAIDLLARETFDLVVIGAGFSRNSKLALAKMARACKLRVVLVVGVSADRDIPADSRVGINDGTAGILKAVQSLLPRSKAAAG